MIIAGRVVCLEESMVLGNVERAAVILICRGSTFFIHREILKFICLQFGLCNIKPDITDLTQSEVSLIGGDFVSLRNDNLKACSFRLL